MTVAQTYGLFLASMVTVFGCAAAAAAPTLAVHIWCWPIALEEGWRSAVLSEVRATIRNAVVSVSKPSPSRKLKIATLILFPLIALGVGIGVSAVLLILSFVTIYTLAGGWAWPIEAIGHTFLILLWATQAPSLIRWLKVRIWLTRMIGSSGSLGKDEATRLISSLSPMAVTSALQKLRKQPWRCSPEFSAVVAIFASNVDRFSANSTDSRPASIVSVGMPIAGLTKTRRGPVEFLTRPTTNVNHAAIPEGLLDEMARFTEEASSFWARKALL